jgi:plastocyanin
MNRTEASKRTCVGFVLALCVFSQLNGCSVKENVQSTGTVPYVQILDEVKPPTLYARVGDEIRWVNLQSSTVRVGFLNGGWHGHVACEKGFTRFGTLQDLVEIAPESLFRKACDGPVQRLAGCGEFQRIDDSDSHDSDRLILACSHE